LPSRKSIGDVVKQIAGRIYSVLIGTLFESDQNCFQALTANAFMKATGLQKNRRNQTLFLWGYICY